MKNTFKKLLVLVLSLTVALAAVGTGCKKPGGEGDDTTPDIYIPQPPAPTLTLSRSSLALTIGDYFTISATATNTDSPVLWTSDNAAVASVSNNGVVEAINQGVANITATCGTLTKSCEVVVSFGGQTPEIDLLGGFKDDIILSTNSEFRLDPVVKFNNRNDYTDATFNFVSSNPSVLMVNATGNIITNAVSGVVDLTISANWRGKTPANTYLMSKTISVTVQDNLIFYVNGNMVEDYELYTKAEFEGTSYLNTIAYVPTISVNGGAQVPATSTVISNEDIAYLDGNNLVGKGFGETVATINYNLNGKNFVKTFTIFVERPVAQKVGKIEYFSAYQGMYKDASDLETNLTIDNFAWGAPTTIIDAMQGETKLKVENNAILGVNVNADGFTDTVISVGSATEIYEVSVRAAGQFVQTAQDLKDAVELRASAEMIAKRDADRAKGVTIGSNIDYNYLVRKTGYVYLLSDIDATDLTIHHTANASIWHHADEMSFAATFEGNGHVIDNLNVEGVTIAEQNNRAGLFAHLGKDSKVKNVAFTNVRCQRGQLLAFISYAEISNVYVHYTPDSIKIGGVTYYTYDAARAKNLVIEYSPEVPFNINNADYTSGIGLLYASPNPTFNPKKEIQDVLFDDVYVLSEFALATYRDNKEITSVGYDANLNKFWGIAYASNATVDYFGNELTDPVVNPLSDKSADNTGAFRYKNIKQYDSAIEMAKASNDLSSFNPAYWETSSGVPVWHTLKAQGVTLSVDGATPKAAVNVVKGESLTVGLAKNGVLVPNTEITSSDDSVISINGAEVKVIKYSSDNVTVTVKNDNLGVEETFVIKPIIDVNLKLGDSENITVYGEILAGETLTFAVEGATDISVATNNASIVSVNGASITGGNVDETLVTVSFTAGGAEYVVPVTIYVKAAPQTEDDVVLYDAKDGIVEFEDLEDKLILDAQLIVDGAEPVELTITDNKIFGLPKMATGRELAHTVKLVVNTNYNTITFNNVEYWDDIFYTVQEFGETFSFNADNEALIGWYTLGGDIDFKLGDDKYVITDKKHEFMLTFSTAAYNGTYYLINSYDFASNKNVSKVNFDAVSNNGFGGVFDGRGYAMKNYANYQNQLNTNVHKFYIYGGCYGIFTKLYSTATITPVIRNLAIKDMISSSESAVLAHIVSAEGEQYIEDVFVHSLGCSYAAKRLIEETNHIDGDIACSHYPLGGIVKHVGKTHMKNLVLDFGKVSVYTNHNIAHGAHGSLASTVNTVIPTMTVAAWDKNYVDNVVFYGTHALVVGTKTAKSINAIVTEGGVLDTSKYVRNADNFVAYSSTASTSAENHSLVFQGFAPTATVENLLADTCEGGKCANHIYAADVTTGVEPGDEQHLAQTGVYKFVNVISFNNKDTLKAYGSKYAAWVAKFTSPFWAANGSTAELDWKGAIA